MELKDLDVVNYLSGPDTVRDGALVSLSINNIDGDAVVDFVFKKDNRIVRLKLREVQEFNYGLTKDRPQVIEFLKCLATADGDFYLSLDPYDEHERFISERDNDFFRAKSAKLRIDPR